MILIPEVAVTVTVTVTVTATATAMATATVMAMATVTTRMNKRSEGDYSVEESPDASHLILSCG